ncbi:hypothetical protein HMN09_00033000 [Mycena chlorophos]|uniref:F-box domain-containing protein n=1 Tax=Mycena chlorophos TaxID=658473 RepID=A0A8H6TRQ5_MYCCL|nr:hypothetical protein HMN09_00033000 [Mycena chlorophos]
MPVPALPSELWHEILGNLRSEPATLSRCALVCRAMVFPAHQYLFSTLYVDERNLDPLLRHLTSSNPPAFLEHIQHLYIYVWGNLRSNLLLRKTFRKESERIHVLLQLLPRLSHFSNNIVELTLDACREFAPADWDGAWTGGIVAALPALPKLTIRSTSFGKPADFVHLIAAFAHLAHLAAVDIGTPDQVEAAITRRRRPPGTMHTLTYRSGDSLTGGMPFLRWITRHPGQLTDLNLSISEQVRDTSVAVFLIAALGDQLENLSLAFFLPSRCCWNGLTLSPNTGLRTLILRSGSDFGEHLPHLIQTIQSAIESITVGSVEKITQDVWPRFTEALAAIRSLKRVTFYANHAMPAKNWAAQFSVKYAQLWSRGIVVFENRNPRQW